MICVIPCRATILAVNDLRKRGFSLDFQPFRLICQRTRSRPLDQREGCLGAILSHRVSLRGNAFRSMRRRGVACRRLGGRASGATCLGRLGEVVAQCIWGGAANIYIGLTPRPVDPKKRHDGAEAPNLVHTSGWYLPGHAAGGEEVVRAGLCVEPRRRQVALHFLSIFRVGGLGLSKHVPRRGDSARG